MYCRKCGIELDNEVKVCTKCNYDLENNVQLGEIEADNQSNTIEQLPDNQSNIVEQLPDNQSNTVDELPDNQSNIVEQLSDNQTNISEFKESIQVLDQSELVEHPSQMELHESKQVLKKKKKKTLKKILIPVGFIAVIACAILIWYFLLYTRELGGILYIDEDMNLMHQQTLKASESVEYDTLDHTNADFFYTTEEGIFYYLVLEQSNDRDDVTLNKLDLTDKKPEETISEVDDFTFAYRSEWITGAQSITGGANDIIYMTDNELVHYNHADDITSVIEKDVNEMMYNDLTNELYFTTFDSDLETFDLHKVSKDLKTDVIISDYVNYSQIDDDNFLYYRGTEIYNYDFVAGVETLVVDTKDENDVMVLDKKHYVDFESKDVLLADKVEFDLIHDPDMVEPEYPDRDDYKVLSEYDIKRYNDDYKDRYTIEEYTQRYGDLDSDQWELAMEAYQDSREAYNTNDMIEDYKEYVQTQTIEELTATIYKDGKAIIENVKQQSTQCVDNVILYQQARPTVKISVSALKIGFDNSNEYNFQNYMLENIPDVSYDTYIIGEASESVEIGNFFAPAENEKEVKRLMSVVNETVYMSVVLGETMKLLSAPITGDNAFVFEEIQELPFNADDENYYLELYTHPTTSELYLEYTTNGNKAIYVQKDGIFNMLLDEVSEFFVYEDGATFISNQYNYEENSFKLNQIIDGKAQRISSDTYSFTYTTDKEILYIENVRQKGDGSLQGGAVYKHGEKKEKVCKNAINLIDFNTMKLLINR